MFQRLDDEFNFTYDLAADQSNHLCASWFGPDNPIQSQRDALMASWCTLRGPHFLNPPYSREGYRQSVKDGHPNKALLIESWVDCCYYESARGATIVSVLPAAVQTRWWKDYVLGTAASIGVHRASEIRFIPHRVSFLGPNGEKLGNAGVNTCVIIWKPNPGYLEPWVPTIRWWDYGD